jgi:DMSO reductase anchor subunit
MHPALSVIVFTTTSGAGYGLLFWLGLLAPTGIMPQTPWFGAAALGVALALITAGLLASTLHLGHPERAWRAFSQWRSSWLSRESIAAMVTYLPAGLFGLGWLLLGRPSLVLGIPMAVMAVLTIICTAMIYRSLKPVRRWSNHWVVPNYLGLAAMTGAVLLAALTGLFDDESSEPLELASDVILVATVLKLGYWRFIDRTASASTPESATGLGSFGTVRLLDAPHTSENYLLKEMGFQIARKHAGKLRRICFVAGFAAPALLVGFGLVFPGWPATLLACLAVPPMALGVLVERWLFFAEARHAVTLYYGARAV